MHVGQFPASAANSLIQGYCDDFVSLAAVLAQTLEQVSMRGIAIGGSRPALQRIESGMRHLADAVHDLLESGKLGEISSLVPRHPAVKDGAGQPGTGDGASKTKMPPSPRVEVPGGAPGPVPPVRLPKSPTAAPTSARPGAAGAGSTRLAPRQQAENLKGTSQSMPLLSVFQFLGRMRKQGTMHVRTRTEQLAFDLQNGCILATSSDNCPREERLGELLVDQGLCTREDLDDLATKADTTFEKFGQALVQAGIVTSEQVTAALELQVRRRFTRACKDPDASYEFVEGARAAAEQVFRINPVAIA